MRTSVHSMKKNKKPLQEEPKEGTATRRIYDLFLKQDIVTTKKMIKIAGTDSRAASIRRNLRDFYNLDFVNLKHGQWTATKLGENNGQM